MNIADRLAEGLQSCIAGLQDGFHNSFKFTQTGNNLSHPVTWGILAKILWEMPEVKRVAIDPRFNFGGGKKFQPDLAALDIDNQPFIFIDYESPNSSDSRIPLKDIDAFITCRSCKEFPASAIYIVVTTLPDSPVSDWELRWTASGYYNEMFHGRQLEIQKNPYRFWYTYYLEQFAVRDMTNIALVNIDGSKVHRTFPA